MFHDPLTQPGHEKAHAFVGIQQISLGQNRPLIQEIGQQEADRGRAETFTQVGQELVHHCHVIELGPETFAQVEHADHSRELFLFPAGFALGQDGTHAVQHVLEVKGLGNVVRGPAFHEVHGRFGGAVSGHDQEIHVQIALPDLVQQFLPVHIRHAQIADDQIESLATPGDSVQGILAVGGDFHGIALFGQGFLADFPENGLVINNQDLKLCRHPHFLSIRGVPGAAVEGPTAKA